MSEAIERLRALRRQAGTLLPAAPSSRHPSPHHPATPGEDASARTIDDLRRLLRARKPIQATITPQAARDRMLPWDEIAPGLCRIEARLPCDPPPVAIDCAFAKREQRIASDRIVCFDTETTGLAGGTGTRAFMIGTARWEGDGLHVTQWCMTTLAAERDLLAAFADALRDDSVLVSYNGRSYDAPLLATRYRLARMRDPLRGLDHLDLLHPVRRRYRGRWENCRLSTIERHVLGIVRENDLPGREAPAAWLTYLRGGSARDLRRVAEHNRQDMASLSGLLRHLACCGIAPASTGTP